MHKQRSKFKYEKLTIIYKSYFSVMKVMPNSHQNVITMSENI